MWDRKVFNFLSLKVAEKAGCEAPAQLTDVQAFVDQMIEDGDNDFFGLKIANSVFKELFYQEDFQDLTHPYFFKKKHMKTSRPRQSSEFGSEDEMLFRYDELGAPVETYKRQKLESPDSDGDSFFS